MKIYWDSCAWIGFINDEPNKVNPLRVIWKGAENGKYQIWTSSYVHLEVFKGKAAHGQPYPPKESDELIETALSSSFVFRAQVDVAIAKLARDLRRTLDPYGLKSRPDAIHLATAVYWNIPEFHTWDRKHLLDLNGHVSCRDGEFMLIRIPGPETLGPLFADFKPVAFDEVIIGKAD